ncbi:MAG: dihydroorotase [Pseudomonadota bacterium]
MTLHIYNARLLDPASGLDAFGGLIIDGGTIADVGQHLAAPTNAAETLDAKGLCLSPGLIDLRVKTGEPGEEHRETLATASRAAVAGGITSMVVMPDTTPVIDDVALVQFISNQANATALNRIYPASALTKGLKGESMAEIGLMAEAGAIFFTNGDNPIPDAGLQKRAMAYAAGCDALIASRPDERALSGNGVMNSGALALQKGLKGMGADAELIGLQRDIALAQATNARLLVDNISTQASLDTLATAKSAGINVSASISAYSLFFTEDDVGDYLTYCKVNPPFRSENDRKALIEALKTDLVDAVTSSHDPQPPENKRLPFAEASFGAAGLETLLSALLSLVQTCEITLLEALRPITSGPAKLLGLDQGQLKTGTPADLILFDPDQSWLCQREDLRSRSANSPFDGRELVGRVKKTFVAGQSVFSED